MSHESDLPPNYTTDDGVTRLDMRRDYDSPRTGHDQGTPIAQQPASNEQGRDPVRLGELEFKYEQPNVSVDTEARTTKHNLINENVVVQKIGRNPDQIIIDGVCIREEAQHIDSFVGHSNPISLRSERWSGDIIVQSTSTDPLRAKDSQGYWLYDFQITCLEVTNQIDEDGVDYDYDNYLHGGFAI